MVVVPNNPWVFLLKMIILWCFGGTTILGNPYLIGMGERDAWGVWRWDNQPKKDVDIQFFQILPEIKRRFRYYDTFGGVQMTFSLGGVLNV